MISITVICLGKLKEKYLVDACNEYKKRLGASCKIEIVELTPARLSENPSQKEIESALEGEAQKIFEKVPSGAKLYSLCIEGRQLSSVELSKRIESDTSFSTNKIAFVIGSSFGLANSVKEKSDLKLSMSKMTFPHQLARVMLLEQIYRAMQISNGTKYHK